MATETYNSYALILQAIFGFGTLATLYYMRRQLLQMQHGSHGQNLLALVDFIQAPHVREARTVVRKSLRSKHFSKWTVKEKKSADLVCSNYDVLAVLLLQQRIAPIEPFLENWGPSICDCHDILRDYIHNFQSPSQSGIKYWNDFSVLKQRCDNHKKVAS
jgi:hypothetical protein